MRPLIHALVVAAAACLSSDSACGQFHLGDIWVGLERNRLVTGTINPNQSVTPARAFAASFGDSGFDGFTANPGYDAAHVFNPAFRIGFNILAPLLRWNGDGFDVTDGETITLSFLSASRTTSTCLVTGFDLAVQADGGWHRHLSMFLNPPPSGAAAPGIYLLKLELYYTAPGFQRSRPFWLVLNHNDTVAQLSSAMTWVMDNLVAPTCPGDVNGSGHVDTDDLLEVLGAWGAAPCQRADINDTGSVDTDDLLALLAAWGPCP